jgi:hypothetical protein
MGWYSDTPFFTVNGLRYVEDPERLVPGLEPGSQ